MCCGGWSGVLWEITNILFKNPHNVNASPPSEFIESVCWKNCCQFKDSVFYCSNLIELLLETLWRRFFLFSAVTFLIRLLLKLTENLLSATLFKVANISFFISYFLILISPKQKGIKHDDFYFIISNYKTRLWPNNILNSNNCGLICELMVFLY